MLTPASGLFMLTHGQRRWISKRVYSGSEAPEGFPKRGLVSDLPKKPVDRGQISRIIKS